MTVVEECPNLLMAVRPCRNQAMLYLEGQHPAEEASPKNCGIFSGPVCYLALYAALYHSNSQAMKSVSLGRQADRILRKTSYSPTGHKLGVLPWFRWSLVLIEINQNMVCGCPWLDGFVDPQSY